ncbi:hypothetical protein N7517_000837 [Penicillium concentricum]|uniref:Alpha-L-rhamnosidase six-hairpin glycosidase domain-containing protein n=1 Tax=Penicillium concentricum TaxID=293559 RepID=A0A9W9SQZ2_9EURO|nr:uncharacterized protein N7517_000837 [Penicillium concentricum]KAJ5382926.1 hypothetical protein N7517_000837 [Penicillium concentricum]
MKLDSGLFVLFLVAVQAYDDTLGLVNGYTSLSTANFDIKLVKDSQLLASLKPTGESFDFLPFDDIAYRAANGQYHNGNISYRYRPSGSTKWIAGDSAKARKSLKSVKSNALAAAEMTQTLPTSPINILREWIDVDGDLGLTFTLTNKGKQTLEIGSLGFATEFNSIFSNRTAEDMVAKYSLTDPYIGMDAGYLQVTPTSGTGTSLVVTPLLNTSTPLEAWRNLEEPSTDPLYYGSQTFEGFYEWQTHTKAYAENEWSDATPWNEPSSRLVKPVKATNTPVTVGIPGYVVPVDLTARLYIFHSQISEVVSEDNSFKITQGANGDLSLTPTGLVWGRTRVTITYEDGKVQTIHYFITDSAPATIRKLGEFTTTSMWFNDTNDPFHRAPSVMTWDHSNQAQVLQEPRVWMAGLSDEGGVTYLASAMKQSGLADATEVSKLEQFASEVLSRTIQNADFTVRKSLFFYEPAQIPGYKYDQSLDWEDWWSWNNDASYATDRAYDYIHVIGAYWALYRAGRDNGSLLKTHTWQWYLSQAYNTTVTCFATDASGGGLVGYSRLGLMGETVVGELLSDLKREQWTVEADSVEAAMKLRAGAWDTQDVPFGSEMAWDSTGQEGIYYWSNHFKLTNTATKTINSILGYMPTVPHWGWNGNARRYWDFIYGGKLQRIERMIHHYGSSLNALPLLSQFRQNPTDTYLLRVGYGGITGPLSNIRQDGSMYNAFHSFPDTLQGDNYSGDYGPNFLGMMLGSGVYVVDDPDVGLVAYGGNIATDGNTVTVWPRDAVRRRVYIAQMGVYVTISAGLIEEVSFDVSLATSLQLRIVPGSSGVSSVIVWVETPGTEDDYAVVGGQLRARGGWSVKFASGEADVVVSKL